MVLQMAAEKGNPVKPLCRKLSIGRATYYRWLRASTHRAERPGPKEPEPHVLAAMRHDVRKLRHVRRRTWGTETIYDKYGGVIPRRIIAGTIAEERLDVNRARRAAARRYEFVAPDLAWSTDFIHLSGEGRSLRLQDECSRYVLGYEVRRTWTDAEVARFVSEGFNQAGAPLVFKFDHGSEFVAEAVHAMLARRQVIELPSPLHWPRFNGKHERVNGAVRQWLLPLKTWMKTPSGPVLADEMRDALVDHNEDRAKEVLGGRTPWEIYRDAERVALDRAELYLRWSERVDQILNRREGSSSTIGPSAVMEARRLAALAVLHEHKLVRYVTGSEGPEV